MTASILAGPGGEYPVARRLALAQAIAHGAVVLSDAAHYSQGRAKRPGADAGALREWCGVG